MHRGAIPVSIIMDSSLWVAPAKDVTANGVESLGRYFVNSNHKSHTIGTIIRLASLNIA
jgi:hypothetical protein